MADIRLMYGLVQCNAREARHFNANRFSNQKNILDSKKTFKKQVVSKNKYWIIVDQFISEPLKLRNKF